MNSPVTFVRSDDLLDESTPQRLSRSFRLSRRRQITGLSVAIVLLPLLTLLLDALDDQLALDGQVLIYLLAVVGIALVGGVVVAVASAVASTLLLNYFFVEPVHTLSVGDPDQLVALVAFVVVAGLVSAAIELSVQRARIAERARTEAQTMSSLAGTELDAEDSLHQILERARATFRMESVTLKVRPPGTSDWVDVEHAGWAPAGEEAQLRFDIPAGPRARMVGRGPALFAEDQRVLEAFAAAARTAYEGNVLSGEANEARTLASVDSQRTALLAAVGHDLRTPLAGIKAAVTSLRQNDVKWSESERGELLGTIEESTDHLEGVVENLLDASRIEAGALAVQIEPVALDEVAAAALLDLSRSPNVEMDVADDLPLVLADRGLLQRVLVNVLDNALGHGAGAEPVEVVAHGGSESAKLEVIDHGPGVSDAQRERLFEPFHRRDDSASQGVGLGLSIARAFVEAMDGALAADATPGGGLTIRIRLPLAPMSAPS
jgi:two-component system sensor histidine kinase KdpD